MLVLLIITGACAGSTAGGMKISRVVLIVKYAAFVVGKQLSPHSVRRVTLDGERMDEATLRSTCGFLALYCLTALAAFIALSLQGVDLETTVTSVLTCLSNVGPGLGMVGPSGSFAFWSPAAKLVLTLCMLLGRLEFYPVLMLFAPGVWTGRRDRHF